MRRTNVENSLAADTAPELSKLDIKGKRIGLDNAQVSNSILRQTSDALVQRPYLDNQLVASNVVSQILQNNVANQTQQASIEKAIAEANSAQTNAGLTARFGAEADVGSAASALLLNSINVNCRRFVAR